MKMTPLIVDLDGTLGLNDSLLDAIATAAIRNPFHIPKLVRALLRGRYELKDSLAGIGAYSPHSIPLRDGFVDYLKEQRALGRELHLVTASPQIVADGVADRLGVFASATGSRDGINLKGAAKAEFLRTRFPEGFAYAGNDSSDIDVWRHASSILTVATTEKVRQTASQLGVTVERDFPAERPRLTSWLRMMRIHQWSKNLLILVPLILAHGYTEQDSVITQLLGFVCMGLVASGTYIFNDLSDLDADRIHPTKRNRPLASADVSSISGALWAVLLVVTGLTGAFLIDQVFGGLLIVYIILTVSYSLRLKSIVLLDVIILSLLYALRVLMGIALLSVAVSPWLLVFTVFFFFSLSLAKRHVEIVRATASGSTGKVEGRGYLVSDGPLTLSLGIASSLAAVLLLFLYMTNDAYPIDAYQHPAWLWGVSPFVFLWTSRIWLKSHRGDLDDDPVSFALRDPPSILLGALVAACLALAIL